MNMMTLIMCVLFIDSKYASSFRLLTVRLLLVLSKLENGMCFSYKNWLCLLDFWKWCLLDIRVSYVGKYWLHLLEFQTMCLLDL